jgi:hypothetical protein
MNKIIIYVTLVKDNKLMKSKNEFNIVSQWRINLFVHVKRHFADQVFEKLFV